MKKIISLFQRNYEGNRLVRDEVVPGAEWVIAGEGVATRKWDGTCCLIDSGMLYKRYNAKRGKTPPEGFIPAQDFDPVTGHMPGWVLVGEGSEDQYHREAFERLSLRLNGTYELVGPKIQGNPENLEAHYLIPHGKYILTEAPRSFGAFYGYFKAVRIEGIVWHHPDGRMVKIKAKDFGLKRGGGA